jgi:hypothetical protein
VLDVLGVWNLLAVRVLQSVRPWLCNLGDDKGPFPLRVELVTPSFILNATEDQVTNVERPFLDVAVMVVSNAL